ncbi:MAG: hypothetical protein IK080_02090 [Clostridia bacterium]|nr:hypothetical protein [Clostridia bacterium]
MTRRILPLIMVLSFVLLSFSGCGCRHEWKEATCATPKTCILCGATEGTTLAHTWKAATCTAPKTCTVCGATEGESLPHSWKAATCTTPKTCSVCGTTEGEALGHTPGTWAAKDASALGGKEILTCVVCGETLETRNAARAEKKEVTVLTPTGLVMNAEEFAQHLLPYLPEDCYITDIESDGFKIRGSADVDVYYDDEMHNYKDNIGFSADSPSDIIALLPYLIPAVDPAVKGSKLDSAVKDAEDNLDYHIDAMVPLSTGVGYTHYTEPIHLTSMTIPGSYWFYFFTLQQALS